MISELFGEAGLYSHEVAVKVPRFRIAWLMAIVAIAALNFGAIRALVNLQFRAHINGFPRLAQIIGALILGALPMATVLVFGLLIGTRRRALRPLLLGFEMSGATAHDSLHRGGESVH